MQSSIHSRGLFVLSVHRERKKGRKKGKEGEKEREKGKETERRPRRHRLRRRAYGTRSVLGADTPGPHFFLPANMCLTPAVPFPRTSRRAFCAPRGLSQPVETCEGQVPAFLADFVSLRRVRMPDIGGAHHDLLSLPDCKT